MAESMHQCTSSGFRFKWMPRMQECAFSRMMYDVRWPMANLFSHFPVCLAYLV
eukprot:CAMPEP_0113908438 /NCGR_PEP_ID=MMETSP0780_2-20120614/26161_1 /TAXON_ID=652834 /ORGANISM="Palpitomonas bilix" /LENGTH=52 /DNA_ID=CAMNT_0000903865 /DNA_START=114 /DNA_END=268 /DNA_ORIENTATION=- /assembly_acc=CAM_ASM_000599